MLEAGYHEHVDGLLLLAAAHETALLAHLVEALSAEQAEGQPPLVSSSTVVLQKLLLTLLSLCPPASLPFISQQSTSFLSTR
ncbi:MAG TPA: hypothetical protein VKR06_11385 [Ktedonosporobacter sp.]|nr:hypothetical protein [Ktedonosporobacter sp.]